MCKTVRNKEIKETILRKIEEYDRILIFRHIRPDGDCVGASKGLKTILKASFPEKEIYVADEMNSDFLAFMGKDDGIPDDELCKGSLAIVVDTSGVERISNNQYALCREIIKIDHHINRTPFGDYSWVEDERSSVCEMIADFYSTFPNRLILTKKAAYYLYVGMITDSGRFRYSGVNSETMRLAGLLLDTGIDTENIYSNLYLVDYEYYKLLAYVYEIMQRTENGVAYLYISLEMQKKYNLSFESASALISNMDKIRGCICWIAFIENPSDGSIRARVRSRFMESNALSEQFGGGGHAMASGATLKTRDEVNTMLEKADSMVKEYKDSYNDWL